MGIGVQGKSGKDNVAFSHQEGGVLKRGLENVALGGET